MRKIRDDAKIQKTLLELKALLEKLPPKRSEALDAFLTAESEREERWNDQKIEKRRWRQATGRY
jgi:hypothetical protein